MKRDFSLRHGVQTGSGAQRASYPMCTSGYYPGDKVAGDEADNSSQSSLEVKSMWSYSSTPPYVFMTVLN
jgi:hypothetical protein